MSHLKPSILDALTGVPQSTGATKLPGWLAQRRAPFHFVDELRIVASRPWLAVVDVVVLRVCETPPGNKPWAKSNEIVFQPGLAPGFLMESSSVRFWKHSAGEARLRRAAEGECLHVSDLLD